MTQCYGITGKTTIELKFVCVTQVKVKKNVSRANFFFVYSEELTDFEDLRLFVYASPGTSK